MTLLMHNVAHDTLTFTMKANFAQINNKKNGQN
jgi:hypothetical protein